MTVSGDWNTWTEKEPNGSSYLTCIFARESPFRIEFWKAEISKQVFSEKAMPLLLINA